MKRRRARGSKFLRQRTQEARELVAQLEDVFGPSASVQVLSWGDPSKDPLYRRKRAR